MKPNKQDENVRKAQFRNTRSKFYDRKKESFDNFEHS